MELQDYFMAGLGALTMSRDKAKEIVDDLVEKGEVKEDDAKGFVTKLMDKTKEQREALQEEIEERLEEILEKMGVDSLDDLVKKGEKQSDDWKKKIEEQVTKTMDKIGVVTKKDFETLVKKVDKLAKAVK